MSHPNEQAPKVPPEAQNLYAIMPRAAAEAGGTASTESYESALKEPFEVFIIKAVSRCNLKCDYCYMYTAADQGWRKQPIRMSRDTITATAQAINQHAQTHALEKVLAVIHGGEPLLGEVAEPGFLKFIAQTLRSTIKTQVRLGMQTNGVLLTPEILDTCRDEGIVVGLSLDGPSAVNDRHRVYADGRGSHADTEKGLRLLQQYPDIYGTLLCVIDTANDPVETYEYLASFNPPEIEFLLPHANWNSLPPDYKTIKEARNVDFTPYADWLGAIASIWIHSPKPNIPLFEERLRIGLGQPTRLEYFGDDPLGNVVTIETDGSIEVVDIAKITEDGAPQLGLHVAKNTFDDAIRHPKIRAQRLGQAGLAAQCLSCDVLKECGGGYAYHRFDGEKGFRNPSVYCTDLQKFIRVTGLYFGHFIGGSEKYAGLEPLIDNADKEAVAAMLGYDGVPKNGLVFNDTKLTYS